ncbi:YHS domain-containing (seleno)protein [Ekhidna sp. To15]|uniref:YHS domain-containing (seleno)protein n=1 Tax=Ekhidna sp. To15 TaxID=3395267 RepID=UPI003F51CF91
MKKISTAFLVTLVVFAASAQEYNTDDSKIAMNGYSPVSYLDLQLAQRGSKEYMSEVDGVKYFFTSEDQKKSFNANPKKYQPQYGGWCATGVAIGAKFRVDPNKFVVKDGKYYLFLNSIEVDAKQVWNEKGHKNMVKNANENWKKLKTK